MSPDEWDWWYSPWCNLTICGNCRGIFTAGGNCPICDYDDSNYSQKIYHPNAEQITNSKVYPGALFRTEFILVELMYREWTRPIHSEDDDKFPILTDKTSPRVLIIILYWSYFEGLMGRFFETATKSLPDSIANDLLNRYSSIGNRLYELYKVIFEERFKDDLVTIGYPNLMKHIKEVQKKRNLFIHDNPEAIDSNLIDNVLGNYHELTQAWIKLYNFRCTDK